MDVYTGYDSPLGELRLTGAESADGFVLTSLSLPGRRHAEAVHADRPFAEAVRQLDAYFGGRGTRFDLPCAARGTEFQQRVWRALDDIPYGTTTTYGELTARLGVPRTEIRAVGAAVGANPLLLVRPCHRVIGADGSMRGYAGGVENKVRLLTHEGALQPMLG
ncbi:methylated-DNA--[protein]-cysteine S-methyltransferase [Streptomyces sp. NPDC001714]|uniref:methylated-DNA--[protein]-cysteine S-methyltransferase n=1 Tax=Streptomyces sp. NPDC001714 TaxID=3364603 RepID=UPI0036CFA095